MTSTTPQTTKKRIQLRLEFKQTRKASNILEAHLIEVLKAWEKGENCWQTFTSLSQLYETLKREKQYFCNDHNRIDSGSVFIQRTATYLAIGPKGQDETLRIYERCE